MLRMSGLSWVKRFVLHLHTDFINLIVGWIFCFVFWKCSPDNSPGSDRSTVCYEIGFDSEWRSGDSLLRSQGVMDR